jgi:hypothetical protein
MFVIRTFGLAVEYLTHVYLSYSKNVNRITKETFSYEILVTLPKFFCCSFRHPWK